MPIAATDLIAYNCANKDVQDDTSTAGGARDVDHRPDFTQLAANDEAEAVSDNAGDTTQTVTVVGRDAGGDIQTVTMALNGTTPVVGTPTTTFERILSITMSADAVGTVTVRRDAAAGDIFAIVPAERGASMLFQNSASEASIAIRHDKIFWENAHATLSLTSATVELTADPTARIRMGVATTLDDTATIANRKTVPGGITFVDDSVKQNVANSGSLTALTAQGVWIEQNLPADDPPANSSFTVELAGNTT